MSSPVLYQLNLPGCRHGSDRQLINAGSIVYGRKVERILVCLLM